MFYDELAIEFYNDEHFEWEDRFLLLGLSSQLNLLMVCHCYRKVIPKSELYLLVKLQRMSQNATEGEFMQNEYDLSKMKSRPNPYAKRLKKQVTLCMEEDIVEYFKNMSKEAGIPYQSMINLYLRECVSSNRKLKINWASS